MDAQCKALYHEMAGSSIARLPRHHDRDNSATPAFNGVKDGIGDLALVRVERLAGDVPGKASNGRFSLFYMWL